MRTGQKPLLFTDDSLTWNPYLADPAKSPTTTWHSLVEAPDIRLVNVWRDLRDFAVSVNLAYQTQRKIAPVLFQEVLISAQYRLHHLAYGRHEVQEALRLAMLILSASLFLSVHSIHPRPLQCKHLEDALRASLQAFAETGSKAYLELRLWLACICGMSLSDGPQDRRWLEQYILRTTKALGLTTWVEARAVLKGFLWVDITHDKAGETILSSARSSDVASPR